MESEAGYLPAGLGEGGTYRTTFRVEILAQKFKNGRKIQKMGAEIQKFKKFFGLRSNDKGDAYLLTAASRPRAILSSANRSGREGGGGRHVLAVASVGARGGGGTCKATAGYTYVIFQLRVLTFQPSFNFAMVKRIE